MSAAPAAVSPRSTSRRTPLIIIGASLLLVILVAVVFRPPAYMRGAEGDPENPDPNGAMAIAEILRDHGAEVKVVRSVSSALAADTDLLVVSNAHLLSTHQLHALEERALDTVLMARRSPCRVSSTTWKRRGSIAMRRRSNPAATTFAQRPARSTPRARCSPHRRRAHVSPAPTTGSCSRGSATTAPAARSFPRTSCSTSTCRARRTPPSPSAYSGRRRR